MYVSVHFVHVDVPRQDNRRGNGAVTAAGEDFLWACQSCFNNHSNTNSSI